MLQVQSEVSGYNIAQTQELKMLLQGPSLWKKKATYKPGASKHILF